MVATLDALRLWHLVLLSAWGGLVLAETVVESLGFDAAAQPFATRAHFWMDVLVELPLLCGVLVTGAFLTAAAWPLTTPHWVKIAAALIAIGANGYCAVLVAQRYRRRSDARAVARLAERIRWTGAGIPAGLVALYIGARYFL